MPNPRPERKFRTAFDFGLTAVYYFTLGWRPAPTNLMRDRKMSRATAYRWGAKLEGVETLRRHSARNNRDQSRFRRLDIDGRNAAQFEPTKAHSEQAGEGE